MISDTVRPIEATAMMRALRLHVAGGPEALGLDSIAQPEPGPGEVLVRVHAAALTRDELTWPLDRLPAIPSYELSGVVTALGAGVEGVSVGEAVYALTPFDRDGVAAEYAAVPAGVLAPKPRTLDHAAAAAVPLAALSAWQGLFDRGGLERGERVLIHGAAGAVGHLAVQLARWRGAHVIGTALSSSLEVARRFGAHEVHDRASERLEQVIEAVDLVFDTVGGNALAGSPALLKPGGRIVSIAEAPPAGVDAVYFVVEPSRERLIELGRLIDDGELRASVDAVYPLGQARAAFEHVHDSGRRGKVVLRVAAP